VIIATLAKEEAVEEAVAGAEAAAPGISVERGKKEEEAAKK
jgi:hypothetical protein